ncbi:alpha/beta hydrolase [Candidatus Pelagibacter sp.]|nr:alpha/beta hydrolase [Candidatus Pelagibacter sp.]MDC1246019.1 alpha/beta hydrolase [Pelagibacteraceae bacterium]
MIFQVDNKNVFASDSGQGIDKNKGTIIFLHGSGLSHIVWSLIEQYLSNQNYNVLAIDLPGHGNSEGNCLKSIEEVSDWLEKVFIELNISKLTIIGHSQGCLEALEYSSKYSKRVKNLIFIGGSYRMPVNQDLIDLAESGDDKSVQLMMKWSYENSKKFIGGNPVEKIINSPRNIREVLATDLVACNNYKNGSEALKSINCPTLFIFGELDKMVSLEKGKKFAELIPNSKTHIIKDCGHMIMFEKAFEMREKISEFLKK